MNAKSIVYLFLCFYLAGAAALKAQFTADTIAPPDLPAQADTLEEHSVLKATLYSTALPGLGQAYNKRYWKIPIIYAALGTTTYFIIDNNRQYKDFLQAFYNRIDDDSTTTDPYVGIYNERQLIELQNIYRKWRDLSIIITGVIYGLNVLDAHVDAHLFYYNVDDNLSLHWEPAIWQNGLQAAYGFSIKLHWH